MTMTADYTVFAGEMGYTASSTVHLLRNGQRLKIT
jgi:hypothetical protein